jgi:hypothetical protein
MKGMAGDDGVSSPAILSESGERDLARCDRLVTTVQ